MHFTTHIINFKKIGSKLWPWQCPRARIQNGRRDVIKYANELKMKRAQLDHCGTNLGKFGWNRPSSFAILTRTDRQTDRHTHTHTQTDTQTDNPGFPDLDDHNTFSQWKWMNVKNWITAFFKRSATAHVQWSSFRRRLTAVLFAIINLFRRQWKSTIPMNSAF